MSHEITGLDSPPVTLYPGQGRAESSLRRLTIRGQPFFILKQRGSFGGMAYDHGRLLAKEIEKGAFPEIISTILRGIDLDSAVMRKVAAAIYRGYSSRVLDNVSDEFKHAANAFADGYQDGAGSPRFTQDEVRDALVAIEVGNIVDGLARVFQIPALRAVWLPLILPAVLPSLLDDDASSYLRRAATEPGPQEEIAQALKQLTSPNNRIGLACTGFSVPEANTRDGRHLHARNLDADLYNWNRAPVLFLIDETPTDGSWHKYVAFGTAGLIYPGGISGLNDAGVAVSLHQLSTTEFDSDFWFDEGEIAPFMQQRILREAATLHEAVDVAKSCEHFAAWTVFCSDAKSGKAIRIEFNGKKVRVSKPVAEPLAQTNHFLDPDMVERHFDEDDAHFTPTFGKWLETHARFDAVTAALHKDRNTQRIDVDWAIEQLASSLDWSIEEIRKKQAKPLPALASARAYGRVPRKAYGQLGSVVLADPQRRSGHDEVWMTTGDKNPSPHSTYCGWTIDWEASELAPVRGAPLLQVRSYDATGRKNWEESLTYYVWARLAISRPRDDNGELLRRAPTKQEIHQGLTGADTILTSAIETAAQDRILEIPYHYMRARVRHAAEDYEGAKSDWDMLRDIWEQQNGRPTIGAPCPVDQPLNNPLMHPYEVALVALYSTATEDALSGGIMWQGRSDRLADARIILNRLKQELFGQNKRVHFDLEARLDLIDVVEKKGGQHVDLPEPNFITVE